MSIRPATCQDVAAIAQIQVASWQTTYKGIMPDELINFFSLERRTQQWNRVLYQPDNPEMVYVAEDEQGQPVGFVSGGPQRDQSLPEYQSELYAIYLLEAAQGKGHGLDLATVMAEALAAKGYTSMLLWVASDNHKARRFYEALGGQVVKTKTEQMRDFALIETAYGWPNLQNWPKKR